MKFKKGSIRRSLYFSILDGLFTAMMLGVSEYYLVPYGIALGAGPSQIAFLSTVPMLIATLLQVQSARVAQSIGSRTKLIRWIVFFHALSWLPIILIPYALRGFGPKAAPWALLFCVVLYTAFAAFAVPAWQSLMSDYIPVKKRGSYFGWRNRLQGILTVLISILAGLVLNYFGKGSLAGFTLIFVFAMLCRFYAWLCLTQMVEPYRHSSHDAYFSFVDFLKDMRTGYFARLVLFVSLMSFSVSLSAPLLAVFLLKDLGYSYLAYMAVMMAGALSTVAFLRLWGVGGDRAGNMRLIRWAGWGIALTPLLWMVSRHVAFVFFIQAFAGCVWGGYTLLFTNFMMEAVTPERRIRSLSYFNVLNSFMMVLGAAVGSVLITRLPPLFGHSYLTLFLISCVARVTVMGAVGNNLKEVRQF